MALTLQQWLKQTDLYLKELPKVARSRFTTKIMLYAAGGTPPDVDTKIRALLTKAKTLAKPRLSTVRTGLGDDLKRTQVNEIRAGILYGTLGANPGIFLDGATPHEDLLDFIIERRFRSIQRMLSFINFNKTRKILAYPAAGPRTAHVNKQSSKLWVGVTPDPGAFTYPFVLSAEGKLDPKAAIEKLFIKNDKEDERTRVDCPAAAMITHLDALLVAKNPKTLADALANEAPDYLAIDNAFGPVRLIGTNFLGGFAGWTTSPSLVGMDVDVKILAAPRGRTPFTLDIVDRDNRDPITVNTVTRGTTLVEEQVSITSSPLVESTMRVAQLPHSYSVGAHLSRTGIPSFHAVSDERERSLFDHSFILQEELQIGDHIYVANHPLHRSRLGSTIWNGEHSFVLDPWHNTRGDILVTGHGVLKLSISKVTWIMLEEINSFLDLTRKLVAQWLALPATTTPAKQGPADDALRRALGEILLLDAPDPFVGTFRAFNLAPIKYRKNGEDKTYPSTWVMDLEGVSGPATIDRKRMLIFDYNPNLKKANPAVSKPFTNLIAVLRHDGLVSVGLPPKKQYAVSYIDDNAGVLVYMPLYYPLGDKKGKEVRLGYSDVQDSVIFSQLDGSSGKKIAKVFVTRPKVAATTTYIARLKQIGAIAP